VGYGDDWNVVEALTEDNRERIAFEECSAGPVQIRRAGMWSFS